MKTRVFTIIAATAVLLLAASSCSTTRYVSAQSDYTATWVGRPTADIIAECGAPDRETTDGSNGRILVYEDFHTEVITRSYPGYYGYYGPWGHPWMGDYRTESHTEKSYVHFYVNSNDRCYQVITNHVKPDGTQIDPAMTAVGTVGGIVLGTMALRALLFPFLL